MELPLRIPLHLLGCLWTRPRGLSNTILNHAPIMLLNNLVRLHPVFEKLVISITHSCRNYKVFRGLFVCMVIIATIPISDSLPTTSLAVTASHSNEVSLDHH